MPVKTTQLTFTGGLHFEAETGSGRTYAYDDESTGGLGPLESVLSSLAACSAMDVISIALKKRQGVDRYVVHARAEQRDEYPMIFTRIDLVHEVAGTAVDTEAIKRCVELSATKYCPVSAMISAGATVIHHRYRIASDGERPFEAEGLVISTGPYQRPEIIA